MIFSSSYDLLFVNNSIPAADKTKNNKNSKISFLITKDPPKKAKGIEPTMNGISNFKLCLPAFTYVIEFPETTMILQIKAIQGKINKEYPKLTIAPNK